MAKIVDYYRLTKPGIIRGNMVHIIAGSLLAYSYGFSWPAFIGVVVGTSLIIASACVANNYIDRDIDRKMKRTKQRALVTGVISVPSATVFGTILLLVGFGVLVWLTNPLVCLIGFIAYIFYVFIYAVAKRTTVHSTLIGSIPGALPAMAGYVAISGQIDPAAWLIFLLIVCWQMPHFYAISLFRRAEYKAAGLPVLGVIAPLRSVKIIMATYLSLYVTILIVMLIFGVLSVVPYIIMLGVTAYWVWYFYRKDTDTIRWARRFFKVSLLLPLALLVCSGVDILLG